MTNAKQNRFKALQTKPDAPEGNIAALRQGLSIVRATDREQESRDLDRIFEALSFNERWPREVRTENIAPYTIAGPRRGLFKRLRRTGRTSSAVTMLA